MISTRNSALPGEAAGASLKRVERRRALAAALFPAFEHFPREASIIGDLLTGYSAIEYQLCMCAGMGGGDVEKAITELFSKRGETPRVKRANRLGGAAYAAAGLGQEFDTAIDDILQCVRIRNQYAHCIWWRLRDVHGPRRTAACRPRVPPRAS
jgi:hypothetical protein